MAAFRGTVTRTDVTIIIVMMTAMRMPMTDEGEWLPLLLTWLSPSYPVGAYSYSHGLEWAVEQGEVLSRDDLAEYVGAVLEIGGGWSDLVLAAAAWRAVVAERRDELAAAAELALALRPTSEFALESLQQGMAFAATTSAAWPDDAYAAFRGDHPEGLAYAIAVGAACATRAPLRAMLVALAHSIAANLVSAGVRLIPLGQTDGQRALAALHPKIAVIVARAMSSTIEEAGSSTVAIDLFSMRHETQYTRLFRS
ncbi:urease accessory protein UreF [Methylocella silvestris]|nr:urease accessory UreF family protein [Methylocella silvestris]